MGYIYKITNKINNKIYIGQHQAKEFDDNYYGSGIKLWDSYIKYGISDKKFHKIDKKLFNNFFTRELLCECDNINELNNKEKEYIQLFDSNVMGYNLLKGGGGNIKHGSNYKKLIIKHDLITNKINVNTKQYFVNQGYSLKMINNVLCGLNKTHKNCVFKYFNIQNKNKRLENVFNFYNCKGDNK